MRSAAEWEDEIYMTKFRLIKELYQGEGGQDSLKEYFDILESKELLAGFTVFFRFKVDMCE